MKWTIKKRIIALGVVAAFIPCAFLIGALIVQKTGLEHEVKDELMASARSHLESLAMDSFELAGLVGKDTRVAGESRTLTDVPDKVRRAIEVKKIGETGYVFVLGGSGENRGRYVISQNGERDGEDLWDVKDAEGELCVQDMVNKTKSAGHGNVVFHDYFWKNEGDTDARKKITALVYYEPLDWVIGASSYEDEFLAGVASVDRSMDKLTWVTVVIGLLAMIGSCILAINVGRQVVRPIEETTELLKDIAEGEGDLTKRLEERGQDEMTELCSWFNKFVAKLHETIADVKTSAESVAISASRLKETSEGLGSASEQIAATMGQVAEGSQSQTKSVENSVGLVEKLGHAIDRVANEARMQTNTVEETAGSINQIDEAINSVAGGAENAAETARQVSDVAREGGEQVVEAVKAMDRIKDATDQVAEMVGKLGDSSQKIGAIVETIDDIAEQTNLLALNAAIEAARAGEHGKGFAVVAEEVRKLAERSSKATGEIAELITSIQNMTGQAVEAMERGNDQVSEGAVLGGKAGEALARIQEAVSDVVSRIETVSHSANNMKQSSQEVMTAFESLAQSTHSSSESAEDMAQGSTELKEHIEQVAAISQENGAAAQEVSANTQEQNASVEELAGSAEEMASMASDLQKLVNQFRLARSEKIEQNNCIDISHPDTPRKRAA